MKSPDLIKLAPTLSAEERFKILIPDYHRVVMGEEPLISESERAAIIKFDNMAVWEEYTGRVAMLQWANALWTSDIEIEKFRALACYLIINHSLEKIILTAEESSTEEDRAGQYKKLKEYVGTFEESLINFYNYQEAIPRLEQELYGVPAFNERTKKQIAEYYESINALIGHHNDTVHAICKNKIIREYLKPIAEDAESYLIKKPIPDKKYIEEVLIDGLRMLAESEVRMLR